MPAHHVRLDPADAIELGESSPSSTAGLGGNESILLATSLHRFVGTGIQ